MVQLSKPQWLLLSALSCLTAPSLAMPGPFNELATNKSLGSSSDLEQRKDRVALRILPFGASIMSGWGSSSKDGLRRYLRDALRLEDWDVNMVGTKTRGEMKDNDHEAVAGDEIDDAEARLKNAVGYKPNVVIINLGTNDAVRQSKVEEAGKRMENVLNHIWGADGMSKTCIFLSTLIPTNNQAGVNPRLDINEQYRELVRKRSKDKCIYLADMAPNGQEWFVIPDDFLDYEDPHVHPNDQGHAKMAAVFLESIHRAASDGKIAKAEPIEEITEPFCDKFEGTGTDAGGKTQRGSGYADGFYSHDSKEMGKIWEHESPWDRSQWHFARLFHSQYDDLVAWVENDDDKPNVYATWANSADGKGKFSMLNDMHSDMSCEAEGVNFIDMNADGLDDLVCLDSEGNAYLSLNQGDGDRKANRPPSFKNLGLIKHTETTKREYVHLADIDGDGRGDYGVSKEVAPYNRYAFFWRNGWVDDTPKYWQALGQRGVSETTLDTGYGIYETRYDDINGDGRADAITMGEYGDASMSTNSLSCRKGVIGNGLNVAWRYSLLRGKWNGQVYLGVKAFADKAPGVDRFHFARIYGEPSAFGNLAKKDYVWMKHEKKSKNKHHFEMRVWKNTGEGSTKIKVDGNKYCNMMGHEDGKMDYVWTFQGGKMEIFVNRGKSSITDNDPEGFWEPQGTIWSPPRGMHRKDLHLADWDGDGKCDIIYVDPDNNNAIQVWLNKSPGKWDRWDHLENPAPGVTCSESRGIGLHDLAVRFADLTGNKRADYMCIKPNGHVSAFLHPDGEGSWENAGQIKFAEGKDRANLRWADVNGDGLDDMIWIEKFSGDSWVWYNSGRGSPSTGGGSSFYWRPQEKKAYAGLAAGACIFYADLNGDGRADEHYVLESFNNVARTSLAPSCGLTDAEGDDGNMQNNLPTPPATNPEHCTGGKGPEGLETLCEYACKFDYCIAPCECTSTGKLRTPPSPGSKPGKAAPGQPDGVDKLCAFACSRDVCPEGNCVAEEDSDKICNANDPQDASSWEKTGAATLVDTYIKGYGYKDWLRGADVLYNLKTGHSGLNCDNIASLHCPGPDGACSTWSPVAFWYVRHMVTSIAEHFQYARNILVDEDIRKLGLVDQMVQDFKTEPPAESELKKILTNLSGAAGLASAIIGTIPGIGSAGATIFSLLGGIVSMANVDSKKEPEDLDKVAAYSKAYVIAVMDRTNEILHDTLMAFFGNGDTKILKELYDKLRDAKVIKGSTRATEVGRALDGGEFMVPVDQSKIADSFEKGIKATIAALLGNMLAGLHYMVVAVPDYQISDDLCTKVPACRIIEISEECRACPGGTRVWRDFYYLVRRPKGSKNSEVVPKEEMEKLKDTYHIDPVELFKNVRACNNKKPSKEDKTGIYMGTNAFPPCYFGLAYVKAGNGVTPPLTYISNKDDLPDWITSTKDGWKLD